MTNLFVPGQLAMLDLVFEIDREPARIDLAPGELARIRREIGHFQVVKAE